MIKWTCPVCNLHTRTATESDNHDICKCDAGYLKEVEDDSEHS